MFLLKPDYEKSRMRMEAFWEKEILDRPVVQFPLFKPTEERTPMPVSGKQSAREEWLDVQYQAEWHSINLSNQLFLGDSMPVAWPNLGPDVFAAFYGCPLHFMDANTSWSEPAIHSPADYDRIIFDWNSPWLAKLLELTDAFLSIGKGRFITGMPDWHTGGDCLAALRGSMSLAIDLVQYAGRVKSVLLQIEQDYERLYGRFFERLKKAGQPISTWVPLISDRKYYPVSNDFSIMVGSPMYRELFLEGVMRECRFLDHSIYHLDGPDALRHLDIVLEIADLDAVQFVPTPGDDAFSRWSGVYERIQAAGKCVQVNCRISEIGEIIRTLRPEGLYLYIRDVPDQEAARDLIQRLEKWCINAGKSH